MALEIGIVVVGHGRLAEEMVRVARYITGETSGIAYVNVEKNMDLEEIKKRVEEAIKKVDRGKGVLLLTDMFGGTPSNVCISLMKKGKIEVVTGVNLPMLVKLSTFAESADLREIAEFIAGYGQRNIQLASEVLYGKKGSQKDGGN